MANALYCTGGNKVHDPSNGKMPYSFDTIAKPYAKCPYGGGLIVSADYCLTGDTEIITEYGHMQLHEVVAKKPAVLSHSPEGKLAFKPVTASALIGVVPIWKISFEDGSTVRCTDEHQWVDYYGNFVKTENLHVGSRLRHVHLTRKGSYPAFNDKHCHALIAEYKLGKTPTGMDIDHIDGNRENWSSDNIRFLSIAENRAQGPRRWWANATEEQRLEKSQILREGSQRWDRTGENNPNFGNLKGKEETCKKCGIVFYRPPSHKQKYCSQDCYFNNGNRSKLLPCPSCGISVKVYASSKSRRCCSRNCSKIMFAQKKKGYPCNICGDYFFKTKEDAQVNCNECNSPGGNHKVVAIEFAGEDEVYQITVDDWHTFVLSNGLVSSNSQLELRILSALAKDESMLQSFADGNDLHQFCGSQIYYPMQYDIAKYSENECKKLVKTLIEKDIAEFNALKGNEKNSYNICKLLADPCNAKQWDVIRYLATTKKQRSHGKTVNFAIVYGSGPQAIADALGMTLEAAIKLIASYYQRFPKIKEYIDKCHFLAHKYHKSWTPVGSIRHLGIAFASGDVGGALRKAGNSPIQGAGSYICIMAIILLAEMYRKQKLHSLLVGSIHDSILTDLFPGEFFEVVPTVKSTMESVNKLHGFEWMICPLIADTDVGISWGELVSVKKIEENCITFVGPPQDMQKMLSALDISYKIDIIAQKEEHTPDGEMATFDVILHKRNAH